MRWQAANQGVLVTHGGHTLWSTRRKEGLFSSQPVCKPGQVAIANERVSIQVPAEKVKRFTSN